MRGKTLEELRQQLRAEIGHSTSPVVGQSEADALTVLLQRTQEFLYDEYDWPHLSGVWYDVSLAAGQRYYNLPTQLNYERAIKAFYLWGGEWLPLNGGFDPTIYSSFNSDDDERSDPPQFWRLYNATQFEIWPLPATNASSTQSKVRWIGTQKLSTFVSDSDTADLDDRLIVLFAAAERLAGKARGKQLEQLATRRLAQLKGLSNKTTDAFRIGEGERIRRYPREVTVRIAGT